MHQKTKDIYKPQCLPNITSAHLGYYAQAYTAVSRVVGKNVHSTIPKGNMGYDQNTVPDSVAVKPTFVAFL